MALRTMVVGSTSAWQHATAAHRQEQHVNQLLIYMQQMPQVNAAFDSHMSHCCLSDSMCKCHVCMCW
jgi:hypothetical protein